MPIRAPEPRVSNGTPLTMAERYLERALDFYHKKKYSNAIVDLDDAIRQEPRRAELYTTRGFILFEAGAPDEAEPDLERALKLDPSQWIAHYTRGMIAFNKGEYDTAIAHFGFAQRIVPLRPEVFIYRAAAYYQKADKDKAKLEIDSAIQAMQPDDTRLKSARQWLTTIKKM